MVIFLYHVFGDRILLSSGEHNLLVHRSYWRLFHCVCLVAGAIVTCTRFFLSIHWRNESPWSWNCIKIPQDMMGYLIRCKQVLVISLFCLVFQPTLSTLMLGKWLWNEIPRQRRLRGIGHVKKACGVANFCTSNGALYIYIYIIYFFSWEVTIWKE